MWPETNFTSENSTLPDALARLAEHITVIPVHLLALPEDELLFQRPGKWSKKQVVGHLIDSARYNLERFTEAAFMPELYRFGSYRQDELVVVNQYQTVSLAHLLQLWQSLNRQILYVSQNLTPEQQQQTMIHLDRPDKPFTLSWLIEDYVGHLEHHLKTL
jgi:hypothetical protein